MAGSRSFIIVGWVWARNTLLWKLMTWHTVIAHDACTKVFVSTHSSLSLLYLEATWKKQRQVIMHASTQPWHMLEEWGPDVSVMLHGDRPPSIFFVRFNMCHLGFLNWPVSRHVCNFISILFLWTLTFTDTIVLYFCKCVITFVYSKYVEASKLQLYTSSCGVNLSEPHTSNSVYILLPSMNHLVAAFAV